MIEYREGYKYQLAKSYTLFTPIKDHEVVDEFFQLNAAGILTIRSGYAWDGASGPTFDTAASMSPSLVHDVFCQMMRNKQLPFELQDAINKFFYELCVKAGMWKWRAWLWYKAVEAADCGNPDQGPDRITLSAP